MGENGEKILHLTARDEDEHPSGGPEAFESIESAAGHAALGCQSAVVIGSQSSIAHRNECVAPQVAGGRRSASRTARRSAPPAVNDQRALTDNEPGTDRSSHQCHYPTNTKSLLIVIRDELYTAKK